MTIHESMQECMRAGGSECSDSRSAIPGPDDQCRWICDPASDAQPYAAVRLLSPIAARSMQVHSSLRCRGNHQRLDPTLHMHVPATASRRLTIRSFRHRSRSSSLAQAVASGEFDPAVHSIAMDADRTGNLMRAGGSGSALRRPTAQQKGGQVLVERARPEQASFCW